MSEYPSIEEVAAEAEALGRRLTPPQAGKMAQYLGQLVKWNKSMNLVGPKDWKTIFSTLIVDSLYLADALESLDINKEAVTLDLGAGAGLPGIPLRMIWQRGDYHLVEVREKRAVFMRSALAGLRLPRTMVFRGRAEEESLPLADLIISRAFMPWRDLLDFVEEMLKPRTIVTILANDAPPQAEELPPGWKLKSGSSYPVDGKQRYFWFLSPDKSSR